MLFTESLKSTLELFPCLLKTFKGTNITKGKLINGVLAEMGGTGFEKFVYPCSELKEISRT